MRFNSNTGDTMGMNMVSKCVQYVLDFLQIDFSTMDVIGISSYILIDVNCIFGNIKTIFI